VADQVIACECGKKLRVDERHAGKAVRCPGCRRTFKMPAPAAEDLPMVLPVDEPEDNFAPAPRSARASRPAARREEEDVGGDDDVEPVEDERPRPRKRPRRRPAARRTGGFVALLESIGQRQGTFRAAGGLGIVGFGLLMFAFLEGRLMGAASDTPQQLPLATLAARGPGDNAHVIITDFLACNNIVVERKGVNTYWEGAYVPVVPLNADMKARLMQGQNLNQAVAPGSIRVIVHSTKVHNEQDLKRVFDAPTLQGTVVNSIRSLDSETQRLLRDSYPGADFGSCYILQEGRKPSSAGFVILMAIGGTLLLVVGGLLLVAHMLFGR
jgi:hypothetical protein